jgi:hypothetical protein
MSRKTQKRPDRLQLLDTIEKSRRHSETCRSPGTASASGTVQESFTLNRLTGTIVVNASNET